MSQETTQWLNGNTLIGNTAHRSKAWHYREECQGEENNHYPGPIPIGDVKRRLFNWEPIRLPVYVRVPTSDIDKADGMLDDGSPYQLIERPDRVNIARSDTFADLGMFKTSYQEHNYTVALLNNTAQILGGELGISSAGLLRGGAVAWVEVSVPESVATDAIGNMPGILFRPNIVAATSCDGSLSTTYKRTITAVVCDNTLSAALAGNTGFKIQHSKYSEPRIADARETLQIIHSTADDFASEMEKLCKASVTSTQMDMVLKEVYPAGNSQRGLTRATNRWNKVIDLWDHDDRVAPWQGTAFGVLQAFNTYRHHVAQVNTGTVRSERNMLQAIDGTTDKEDGSVMNALYRTGVLTA